MSCIAVVCMASGPVPGEGSQATTVTRLPICWMRSWGVPGDGRQRAGGVGFVLVPGSACLPLPVPLAYECPASPLTPTALPTCNRIRPPHPAQAPYTTRPNCPGQRTPIEQHGAPPPAPLP
ncbi:hypothetical protein B0H14DRAFT_3473508 [Mycena olivaceomarginata]|nr:hypothetical protein B0H14DRAFT_3473508 [Mycena olivaceomarginata]